MKNKIVLVPFPFDDLSANKLRPAICLTDLIGVNNHVVIAFITSQVSSATEPSDISLLRSNSNFPTTGLRVDSAIRLHRLVTVDATIIRRELGNLPSNFQIIVKNKLIDLFELN